MNKDDEFLLEQAQARLERRRQQLRDGLPNELGQVLDKIVKQIRDGAYLETPVSSEEE